MASNVSTIVTKEVPAFVRTQPHDMAKTLKLIRAVTKEAINVLEDGLKDADVKIRVACAEKLIGYEVSISKLISDDAMTRAVAEVRFGKGMSTNLTTEEQRKLSQPVVDFNTIITV